ncbi:DUF3556 domain-containing protein [Aeromicrobium sp. CTD01-1L150]|uniref:DUF3556 domain-containing protein n=1 Tax=Aeromicrobium sp. CTD01-1L150 TaxID=3341830 RepID=UPI0035C08EDC
MPLMTPVSPTDDPAAFLRRPFGERMRALTGFWAENGFGSPRLFHIIYVLKVLVLYCFGGLLVVSLTSDVGSVWSFGQWWAEPVVYQKLVLWTLLLEVVGIAGTWGPLAGHFRPMTGGLLYWLRPGTLRMPPWGEKVPGTGGDTRTVLDVVLYAALLVSLATAIVLPGVASSSLEAVLPDAVGGLVRAEALAPVIALLVVVGLRDKVIFLAARGEQYLPAVVFFATLGFVDMIVAAKLLIVSVWIGAGVSKLGRHFVNVVPPMFSNGPLIPGTVARRTLYRDAPEDLRPSKVSWFFAHVGGTTVEIGIPLVLLFTTDIRIAVAGAAFMAFFHFFILQAFPLAVPLEWNVLFGYLAVVLFVGFPNADGYAVWDFSQAWMLPVVAGALLAFPILGNLRPDLVSFLPSMRQYAGNWASATWAFAPGCEERLNDLPKAAKNQVDQLQELGFDPDAAELTMQLTLAWRSMHSQGRGLYSLMLSRLEDIDRYTLREAEFSCNTILGWNFGDGHLHDERLVEAIQRRVRFEPGEWIVAFVESQAIHESVQRYRIIDAALGVVERGTWVVADAVEEQPWLPNGPIPLTVEWRLPGWVPPAEVERAGAVEETGSLGGSITPVQG